MIRRLPLPFLFLAVFCLFAADAQAQTLRLRQVGTNATRVDLQVGDVINIEVVADLQGVSSAGIEFFISVPDDAFQVNDLGLPGQVGVQPFRMPSNGLFQGAQTPTNLLLPENDTVAMTLPGQQLNFGAVIGLGSDRNRTGSGVVATFQLVAVQPIENGELKIDDNAIRETRLVLTNGIDERRFVTTQGMEVNVTGMELLDIPDVILQPGQSDSVQIGRLDQYLVNTLSEADSIRWTFEPGEQFDADSLEVTIDDRTRRVKVVPHPEWRGRVRLVWTATDPRRSSPGQPLLTATEVSTIVVNNRPLFDIEPDSLGIKRLNVRLVEDRNTFTPGIATPDPRRAFRSVDLDDLVIDPDVENPDLELNYAMSALPLGRDPATLNVRGADDESNHSLLVWSRPDFGGTDSIGVRISGTDTTTVFGGIDSFRVLVQDLFLGRDTLRVIVEVEEQPDAPRIIETETRPRIARGGTKLYPLANFVEDPDTPLEELIISWLDDTNQNFTVDTTRVAGDLTIRVRADVSFIGTGRIVIRIADPLDPEELFDEEVFFFTAAEALPPSVFPKEIKVPTEPGGEWMEPLDSFVDDPDNADGELRWAIPPVTRSEIGIDAQRNITVRPPPDFHGFERVQLTVSDPGGQSDVLTLRIYSSDGRPVVGGLPDLVLDRGETHREIDLDEYSHDSNNSDSQIEWNELPTFKQSNLGVSIDPLTHILTLSASPNAEFGTETVVVRMTDTEGVSAQDTMLVTIQTGGQGSDGAFSIAAIPPLQAPVGQAVQIIENLNDFLITSPGISKASINWQIAEQGDNGIVSPGRRTDPTHPDGVRVTLTVFGDVSGLDTLSLVATDSLGRSETVVTTIRYFGESELLELRAIPDIVFIAGDLFEGLVLNDFILDPVTHPDSLISWRFEDIGSTASGIIPRINDDSSVRVIGFDIGETELVFIASNDSIGITGRDTVRVIAQDPATAARQLQAFPPLVIQAGSTDSSVVLNDFLPPDIEPAQTNWAVSGASLTNPVIDPTAPHRLRVSSIGTSVGTDTLTFNVNLGGGFRATGQMEVTVIEPIDESTLSLRVVPNPLNANFVDFFVMARTELASSPTVTVNFEGDTTIAVRQIENDLSTRGVLIWSGSFRVRPQGTGAIRFGASAITQLGSSVNAQATITLGSAVAGKPLALQHNGVNVEIPADAVPDGQRVYLRASAASEQAAAGKPLADGELAWRRDIDLWPGGLSLTHPASVRLTELAEVGAGLYRRVDGQWLWESRNQVSSLGAFAVLVDRVAPVLDVEVLASGEVVARITDNGSGVAPEQLFAQVGGERVKLAPDEPVPLSADPVDAGWQSVTFTGSDRAGNQVRQAVMVDVLARLPTRFELGANFPNPFNPETTIPLLLPHHEGAVRLRIYNATGQVVRELLNGVVEPGTRQVLWDGRDAGGQRVGSGVYFYRLEAEAHNLLLTRSMTLLK